MANPDRDHDWFASFRPIVSEAGATGATPAEKPKEINNPAAADLLHHRKISGATGATRGIEPVAGATRGQRPTAGKSRTYRIRLHLLPLLHLKTRQEWNGATITKSAQQLSSTTAAHLASGLKASLGSTARNHLPAILFASGNSSSTTVADSWTAGLPRQSDWAGPLRMCSASTQLRPALASMPWGWCRSSVVARSLASQPIGEHPHAGRQRPDLSPPPSAWCCGRVGDVAEGSALGWC